MERNISRTYSGGETAASGVKILKTTTGGKTEGSFGHRWLLMYACLDTGDLERDISRTCTGGEVGGKIFKTAKGGETGSFGHR